MISLQLVSGLRETDIGRLFRSRLGCMKRPGWKSTDLVAPGIILRVVIFFFAPNHMHVFIHPRAAHGAQEWRECKRPGHES